MTDVSVVGCRDDIFLPYHVPDASDHLATAPGIVPNVLESVFRLLVFSHAQQFNSRLSIARNGT